jgi:hypothetical protein
MKKVVSLLIIAIITFYPNIKVYSYGKEENIVLKVFSKKYIAKLIFDVEKISKMVPIKVTLELKDKKNKIIENQEILFDLIMPDMKMPDNKVKLKYKGKGLYEGELIFTMRGKWRINSYLKNSKNPDFHFDLEI